MSSDAAVDATGLERLSDKIPGYSGYVDRERRRDLDNFIVSIWRIACAR